MRPLKIIAILTSFLTLQAQAGGSCDHIVLAESSSAVRLYGPRQRVFTPESKGTVEEIVKSLEGIQNQIETAPNDVEAQLYREVQALIDETLSLAIVVKQDGYPQNEVARLAQLHGGIMGFPVEFASQLRDLTTGGCSNSIYRFDSEYYNKAVAEFGERYVPDCFSKYRSDVAQSYMRRARREKLMLTAKYLINGFPSEETYRDQFFQYRFLFEFGESPLMRFVEIRETGDVIIGITEDENGDHDQQHGTATSFQRHDYVHAVLQKVRDRRLFDELGITTLRRANDLKRLNHRRLQELIAEYEGISDSKLKAAVEVLLFGLLHEQALSYPLQVTNELKIAERRGFYVRAGGALAAAGKLGDRYPQIFRGEDPKSFLWLAIRWLRPRAKAHADAVTAEFNSSRN